MNNINEIIAVHCDHCGVVNHKCAWEFFDVCGGGGAATECWKCGAWFDPNWENDLAVNAQIARDEIRAERF